MVRPAKLIQAFKDIGYEVFEITGFAAERKAQIKACKRTMDEGAKYDFMYAEASTMPMLLTEPHHYPTHPFLDFGFFKYLRKKGIPIGLFYPDIYWKFDNYGEGLPGWKRFFALKNYELDIRKYEKLLDKFYVSTLNVLEYIGSDRLSEIAEELPPGADIIDVKHINYENRDFNKDPLTVFYVGGLGNQYQIAELLTAIHQTPNTHLILCCREAEWEAEKSSFESVISDRIEVIHKFGEELEPYYQQADICSLLFRKGIYINMAQPVKAYEYLAHEKPVIATKGTKMGDFVEETDIGWSVDYSADSISKVLSSIIQEPDVLESVISTCAKVRDNNTWMKRATQIADDLTIGHR